MEHFDGSTINSIEIVLQFKDEFNKVELIKILHRFNRVFKIILYGCSDFEILYSDNVSERYIIKVSELISSFTHCGKIGAEYFSLNIKMLSESQKFNSCLNHKLSIDIDGNIKNCPSMNESLGNIRSSSLLEAMKNPNFKKYWSISKDVILVCKDCEFRHICTDCRAYLEDPENILSKPLKCGYNPYTTEWQDWSLNPLKEKAIQYYGMNKMINMIE